MARRIIYLIRNGQYDTTEHSQEGALTNVGRGQARLTAEAIRDLRIQHVFCSPHRQVVQTAMILSNAMGLELVETELLRQYDSLMNDRRGTGELQLDIEAIEADEHQLEDAFLALFQTPDKGEENISEAVICHGNLIRDLICRATNVNPASWAHMLINNCGISCVSVEADGRIELQAYNDVRHLPDAYRTE